jgi:hypothetical protein
MPRGDGTGPAGLGPMTGRAVGYCAGYAIPGYANPWPGRGYFGMGRGFWGGGRIWWGRYSYAPTPVYPLVYPHSYAAQQDSRQERDILRQEATELRRALDDIQKRLAEIEGESSQA